MIKDQKASRNLANSWKDVRLKQDFIKRQVLTGFALGASNMHRVADPLYDLVLIYAYAVLEDILKQLRDEGQFSASGRGLKYLMQGSRTGLRWLDFPVADKGRERRNDIAHRSAIVPRTECWNYIDAIEKELISWEVIPAPITDKK